MIKPLVFISILFFSTLPLLSEPPNPHTFIPNRGVGPSKIMAINMKENIVVGIRNVIYVWNQNYRNPANQIADLLKIFKYLSNSPAIPKQILLNKEFEIYRVLDTKKMLKVLDRFQEDTNKAYRALFEYMSLILGTKQGSMEKAYKEVIKDMGRMVDSYNVLAKETNRQYRKKVMPYYALNYKKQVKKR